MNYIKQKLENATRNIEIEIAQQEINLLRQYIQAPDAATQEKIKAQMHPMTRGTINKLISPQELVTRLEAAIKQNEYRPRNMSLFQLAISKDLDYIHGEFNTFDHKLSQMSKDKTKVAEIRKQFNADTGNRFDLAKQFAYDWIRRMGQHPELADAARSADADTEVIAYNALLNAMTTDFCKEYNLAPKSIDVAVVKNWDQSDIVPPASSQTGAFMKSRYVLEVPDEISVGEIEKIVKEFKKSPKTYPGAIEQKAIRLNLKFAKENQTKTGIKVFDRIIAIFAHEMNHALDDLKPREGASGPQVHKIDKEIYTEFQQDRDEYHRSATERTSYAIEHEITEQLKNMRE